MLFTFFSLVSDILIFTFFLLQTVINYGASWYVFFNGKECISYNVYKVFDIMPVWSLSKWFLCLFSGVECAVKCCRHFASWAMNFQSFLSCMRILMSAQKRLSKFVTRPRFNSTAMANVWMRCLVLEKKGFMIDCGCILIDNCNMYDSFKNIYRQAQFDAYELYSWHIVIRKSEILPLLSLESWTMIRTRIVVMFYSLESFILLINTSFHQTVNVESADHDTYYNWKIM